MTAVLDRIGDALTARPATVLFDAMAAADEHIREHERAVWTATFAPPVVSGGGCVCGSVLEIRDSRVNATDDERLAAAERHADLYGHALEDHDIQAVDDVIAAIDRARSHADREFLDAWRDNHAHCEFAFGGDES
ncbi:hypothetical protein BCA37_10555 [Mycobacterium sp. djl-10]|nr:hypothetical protein BCA37_10555 [Mycobacterium sp. djl-10]